MSRRQSIFIAATLIFGTIVGWFFWPFDTEPFLETISPNGTYLVELQGQPKRPLWFTVEVGSVVRKDGSIFWPYERLHSGDAMDISFELGWPDSRWVEDNILQLYSQEEVASSRRQQVTLVNDSDEVIPRMLLFCNDKVLFFDLDPETVVQLSCGPPKGDIQGVFVSGEMSNGKQFEGKSVFSVKGSGDALSYSIHVAEGGVTFNRF